MASSNIQIEILKNNLAHQSGVLEKLQKALSCINPDALYVVPPVLELIKYVIIQIYKIDN